MESFVGGAVLVVHTVKVVVVVAHTVKVVVLGVFEVFAVFAVFVEVAFQENGLETTLVEAAAVGFVVGLLQWEVVVLKSSSSAGNVVVETLAGTELSTHTAEDGFDQLAGIEMDDDDDDVLMAVLDNKVGMVVVGVGRMIEHTGQRERMSSFWVA